MLFNVSMDCFLLARAKSKQSRDKSLSILRPLASRLTYFFIACVNNSLRRLINKLESLLLCSFYLPLSSRYARVVKSSGEGKCIFIVLVRDLLRHLKAHHDEIRRGFEILVSEPFNYSIAALLSYGHCDSQGSPFLSRTSCSWWNWCCSLLSLGLNQIFHVVSTSHVKGRLW